jgi:hypothetical protein
LFEKHFGSDFYDKITKEQFENNPLVRSLALGLLDKYEGKIFRDIEDQSLNKFVINDGKFAFIS